MPADGPEPGPHRSSRTPYLIPIYEATEDPRVREAHMLTASQSAKTTAQLNIIGKRFDVGPRAPAIYMAPTEDLARSVSSERFVGMVRNTPSLLAKWHQGQRDHVRERYIAGTRLAFAWAGSKSQAASRPCGLALADELDRMVDNVGGEGAPLRVLAARLKNWPRSLLVTATTPTVTGASVGEAEWLGGSRELWTWACLACDELLVPWSRWLRWPSGLVGDDAAAEARLVCPSCGSLFDDSHKPALELTGRYVRQAVDEKGDLSPDPDPRPLGSIRSFWVPGLASPWLTFADLAGKLSRAYATHDPNTIQPVINTEAGEFYQVEGDAPETDELAQLKLEGHDRGQVPSWCQALTGGVDVQADRLYWTVRAWGAGERTHTVDYGEVFGDTDRDEVYMAVRRAMTEAAGEELRRVFIDSGYKPGRAKRQEHRVYMVCRWWRNAHPTKGYNRPDARPLSSNLIDLALDGGQVIRGGVRLWRLNAPYWKQWLYSRVRWPADQDAGRWTLPADCDLDYQQQLVAEQLLTTATGKIQMITPRGADDHYGDCEALATAAGYSLHLETLKPKATPAPSTVAPAPARPRPKSLSRRPLA